MMLSIVASICIGMSVFFVLAGFVVARSHRSIRDRLDVYVTNGADEQLSLKEIELSQPFSQRIMLPMIKQASRFFGWMLPQARWNALRLKIDQAGNPGRMSPIDFAGFKGLCTCTMMTIAIGYCVLAQYPFSFTTVIIIGAVSALGFMAPDFWLSRRVKRRQGAIINTLPDAMDLLTITVEAGLSFDNGMQEIVAKWDNEVGQEFGRVLRDIGMGQSRRQSLMALGERTGVADLQTLINALNQAEELGVSIARVLKIQSEELRIKRRQRAQERANQAPIKMMFPLVFLIFPSIFAVLLGPAIPQLMDSFGNLGA